MKKTMFILILTTILLIAIVPAVSADCDPEKDPGCFGEVMSTKAKQKDFTAVGPPTRTGDNG